MFWGKHIANRRNTFAFLIFLLLALVWYLVRFHFYIYFFIDSFVPFSPRIDWYFFSFPWNYLEGHGIPLSNYPFWEFMVLPYYLGSYFGIGIAGVQALEVIFFLTASGYGFYILTIYIFPGLGKNVENVGALLISAFYMYNYYILSSLFWDNFVLWFVYSISPIFFLGFLKVYDKAENWKLWFLLIMLLSVPIAIFTINYPTPVLIFLICMVFVFLVVREGSWKRKFWHTLKISASLIAVNIWLLPYFLSLFNANVGTYTSSYFWVKYGVELGSFGVEGYNSPFLSIETNQLNWSAFYGHLLFVIMALSIVLEILPVVLYRFRFVKKYLFSVAFLLLLESLLAGVNGPLAPIFYLLISYQSPVLIPFQDPPVVYGFAIVFMFSFVMAFALKIFADNTVNHNKAVAYFTKRFPGIKRIKSTKFVVALVAVVVLSSEVYLWTPEATPTYIGSQNIKAITSFPSYYSEMVSYISAHLGDHLILGLPVGAGLEGLDFGNTSFIANNPLEWWGGAASLINGQVSSFDQKMYLTQIYNIVTYANTTGFAKLLASYNIKYVLLQTNFIKTWEGGPQAFNITHLENFLSVQKNITLVKRFGPLWLYKNELPMGMVSSTVPVYFNPTPESPIGKYPLNYTFFRSFTRTNDELIIGNHTICQGHLYAYNNSMVISQYYVNANGSESASVFYSNLPINVSSFEYPYVVVNYTSSYNVSLSVLVSDEPFGHGAGGWYYIYGHPITTGGINLLGTKTVVFANPYVYINPQYFRIIISVSDPQNNTNYSLRINYMYLAKYTNYSEYPFYFMNSNIGNDQVAVLNEYINNSSVSVPGYLTWKEISPVKYQVDVNASAPFFIAFSQTFDRNWVVVDSNGVSMPSRHLLYNGFGNAWIINNTGNYTFYIEYDANNLYAVSRTVTEVISIGTVLALTTYLLLIDGRIVRKVKKREE